MATQDNGVRYLIHKIGTPRLQRTTTGGIAPAGDWWQDTRPNCGQWGDANTATVFKRLNGSRLPDGGEWVEIYLEVKAGE